MLRFASSPGARAALTLCLSAAALGLAGCASKNPLMEDAPAAATSAPASGATTAAAANPATASASTAAGSAISTASTNSGVQTTHNRRFLGIFSPYRVDIQQGNFVSQEMLAQLKPGMSQEQVQFALGRPLLQDIFHANRWDYLFRLQKRNGDVTVSRVTIFFDNKRMLRYEGGNLPSEQDYLAQIAGTPPKSKVDAGAPKAPPAAGQ
ncbi:MAG: hypothetical protein A3K04_10470 [Gallionellales bacterium RBG_16_56_9]|nr:MAG: hypothetical protein A3K04_10470 [Gallionellales bacterium RBG_16_56_9]